MSEVDRDVAPSDSSASESEDEQDVSVSEQTKQKGNAAVASKTDKGKGSDSSVNSATSDVEIEADVMNNNGEPRPSTPVPPIKDEQADNEMKGDKEGNEEGDVSKDKKEGEVGESGDGAAVTGRFEGLTPQEQEMAYELKARMMKRLQEDNTKLKKELNGSAARVCPNKVTTPKTPTSPNSKKGRGTCLSARVDSNDISSLSQSNLVKLMKMYEKQSVKAETRLQEMTKELDDSQELVRRYYNLYANEKGRKKKGRCGCNEGGTKGQGGTAGTSKSYPAVSEEKKGGVNPTRMTDEDLDDDDVANAYRNRPGGNTRAYNTMKQNDALRRNDTYYRSRPSNPASHPSLAWTNNHVKPYLFKPALVDSEIKQHCSLSRENENLRAELVSMRVDNQKLSKLAKERYEEMILLQHNVSTSEHSRFDLMKRLDKEKMERIRLQRTLSRYVSNNIRQRREQQEMEEAKKWNLLMTQNQSAAARRASTSQRNREKSKSRSLQGNN